MNFEVPSLKIINELLKDESYYAKFQNIDALNPSDLENIKKVAQVIMTELNINHKEWDKLFFLVKMASITTNK